MTALERARQLHARGLSVIPVPTPRPGARANEPGDGKVPALAWKPYQTRLATDAELVRWFSQEPMNLAIITGALSALVVVDADSEMARRWCVTHLPYTPWQTKTQRGFHIFYQHPGILIRNKAKLTTRDGKIDIDVRGDGGFVVAPGSVHASGSVYRQAGNWSVPKTALPRFWVGWLAAPERPAAPSRPPRPISDTSALVARGRAYLAAIPVPEIGQGSDNATLYAACRLVRGFGISPADAEALLWDWAGGRPGWTRDWIASKVANAEKHGTEPIGALR